MAEQEHKPFVGDDIHITQEGLVFDPYNELNKEITLSEVQSILTRYGVPGKVENGQDEAKDQHDWYNNRYRQHY